MKGVTELQSRNQSDFLKSVWHTNMHGSTGTHTITHTPTLYYI